MSEQIKVKEQDRPGNGLEVIRSVDVAKWGQQDGSFSDVTLLLAENLPDERVRQLYLDVQAALEEEGDIIRAEQAQHERGVKWLQGIITELLLLLHDVSGGESEGMGHNKGVLSALKASVDNLDDFKSERIQGCDDLRERLYCELQNFLGQLKGATVSSDSGPISQDRLDESIQEFHRIESVLTIINLESNSLQPDDQDKRLDNGVFNVLFQKMDAFGRQIDEVIAAISANQKVADSTGSIVSQYRGRLDTQYTTMAERLNGTMKIIIQDAVEYRKAVSFMRLCRDDGCAADTSESTYSAVSTDVEFVAMLKSCETNSAANPNYMVGPQARKTQREFAVLWRDKLDKLPGKVEFGRALFARTVKRLEDSIVTDTRYLRKETARRRVTKNVIAIDKKTTEILARGMVDEVHEGVEIKVYRGWGYTKLPNVKELLDGANVDAMPIEALEGGLGYNAS